MLLFSRCVETRERQPHLGRKHRSSFYRMAFHFTAFQFGFPMRSHPFPSGCQL